MAPGGQRGGAPRCVLDRPRGKAVASPFLRVHSVAALLLAAARLAAGVLVHEGLRVTGGTEDCARAAAQP